MTRKISDLKKEDLAGKRVLMRVDFNVPLDSNLQITDDTRIKAALPSIKYLMDNQAKVILTSHLGRPKGQAVDKLRLDPIAQRLSDLLGKSVTKLDEAIGDGVKKVIDEMQNSDLVLLENIRFYAGEEKNDADFCKELAANADVYVNDAFGTAHRAHASTTGVASYLSPAVAGFLMTKELEMLGAKLSEPERPFTAIIGGSKISSKIAVLKNLVQKVDTLIVGGGMAFTFLKAQGAQIGQSICEDDQLETAREIINLADQFNTALILPTDSLCTAARDESGEINIFDKYQTTDIFETKVMDSRNIDNDWQGMDAGPESIEQFVKLVSQSKTIVWNGPVGVFEYKVFEQGTHKVAQALVELTAKGGTTIIGGGDSVAALEKFAIAQDKLTHVSTGGGASLEFMEGKTLPGVACLDGFSKNEASDSVDAKTESFSEVLKKAGV